MAVFDESKVINALHPEKAKIGEKYWRSDNLLRLKNHVEGNTEDDTEDDAEKLFRVVEHPDTCPFPFQMEDGSEWQFLYPYEGEQQKKRMTNRQLAEWLARGNGQYTVEDWNTTCTDAYYDKDSDYDEVPKDCAIRPWGSDEWIEPTVDIYERDCK